VAALITTVTVINKNLLSNIFFNVQLYIVLYNPIFHEKISLLFWIGSAVIFSSCSKLNDKQASPINCDNLITDTAGTNDSARIFTPTAFSPNGDGLNDRYRVLFVQIASVDLKVYDENNKIVFQVML
jgi:hypothetical protein